MEDTSCISFQAGDERAASEVLSVFQLRKMGAQFKNICSFSMLFPMFLIRGSTIKTFSRIPKHEDIRHLLIQVSFKYVPLGVNRYRRAQQNFEPEFSHVDMQYIILPILSDGKILKPWLRIVFISHSWLSHRSLQGARESHPDNDNNAKLSQLKELVRDNDYVLFDYMSFPQCDFSKQGDAIKSLLGYVYHCSEFWTLTLSHEHFQRYLTRGWCQLELLAALCPTATKKVEHFSRNDSYTSSAAPLETNNSSENYTSACPRAKNFVQTPGEQISLDSKFILPPSSCIFSVPSDIVPCLSVADSILEQFKKAVDPMNSFNSELNVDLKFIIQKFARPTYSYELITRWGGSTLPEGIDATKKEQYLSDIEFQKYLLCTKVEFEAMPVGRKIDLKRKANLW